MDATYLRALQAEILSRDDCAALRVTPDMGKVAGAHALDQQIADILRAAGWGAGSREVPAAEARNVLLRNLKWRRIVLASQAADDTPLVEAAFAAVALADNAAATIDTLSPKVQAMLDVLQDGALIDAADRAELEALCATPSTVTADDVSRALRGPWGDEA